jgi:hypothetical protein
VGAQVEVWRRLVVEASLARTPVSPSRLWERLSCTQHWLASGTTVDLQIHHGVKRTEKKGVSGNSRLGARYREWLCFEADLSICNLLHGRSCSPNLATQCSRVDC